MGSNNPESVSLWIEQVKVGDQVAAQALWDRYFPDLVRMASARLKSAPRAAADEEDVVLSALNSFFNAAQQGHFPDLSDRDGLWRLLSWMTHRKALDLIRQAGRLKRGGQTVSEGIAIEGGNSRLGGLVDGKLGPELAAMVAEESQKLFDRLPDEQLKLIARGKMEGYTNGELAQRLNCSERTIERRLQLIRKLWQDDEHDE